MRLLLDSHALLWSLEAPEQLRAEARDAIRDPANEVFVSAASVWELAIKQANGRLAISGDLVATIEASHFEPLPITQQHSLAAGTLPPHHQDPFRPHADCSGHDRGAHNRHSRHAVRAVRGGRPGRVKLTIPDPGLVLLVGPSGAGKSTFAGRHFLATEVVSSDFARALVADDPADQSASADAFKIVELIARARLGRRLMTVVDATNLHAPSRRRFRRLAERYGVPAVAIAFDFRAADYVRHNSLRDGRTVHDDVVANQAARMPATLAALPAENYAALYVLRSPEAVARARVERVRQARPGNAAV